MDIEYNFLNEKKIFSKEEKIRRNMIFFCLSIEPYLWSKKNRQVFLYNKECVIIIPCFNQFILNLIATLHV